MAITDGQIAGWNCNGTWTDAVGTNDGTDFGATFDSVNKKLGSSSGYFITNDYVDFAAINPSYITAVAWIRPSTIAAGVRTILSRWYDGSNRSWQIRQNAAGADLFISLNGGDSYSASATSVLTANTWHLVVGTFDGSNLRVFVDNVYKAITAASGTIYNNTAPVRLGADPRTPAILFFEGNIDAPAVWDRALTYGGVSLGQQATGEVAELWNGGVGVEYPIGAISGFQAAWARQRSGIIGGGLK
jgi:hypothetical protein